MQVAVSTMRALCSPFKFPFSDDSHAFAGLLIHAAATCAVSLKWERRNSSAPYLFPALLLLLLQVFYGLQRGSSGGPALTALRVAVFAGLLVNVASAALQRNAGASLAPPVAAALWPQEQEKPPQPASVAAAARSADGPEGRGKAD